MDMTQEVLLTAFRKLNSFEGRSEFGSWLFAIVRNRCLSELRKPSLLWDGEIELDRLPASQADPEQSYIEEMDEKKVLTLIGEHLEPREQEALWLRCFEKMPVDTITEVLGIKEATGARAILQRARRKLRRALGDEGGE
jgi:RNA polymerase sigma-70 factor (ECF subfamily)